MLYPVRGRSLKPDRIAGAVCGARELLRRIGSPAETPKVPLEVRREAQALLRFFPTRSELHPVITEAFALRNLPNPSIWPTWPEDL